jgi:hypothetical protein
MQGIAAQVLGELRVAEAWSAGNVAGAIVLLILVAAAVSAAVLVGRRR